MNDHWNNNGDDSTLIDMFEDIIKHQKDIQLHPPSKPDESKQAKKGKNL